MIEVQIKQKNNNTTKLLQEQAPTSTHEHSATAQIEFPARRKQNLIPLSYMGRDRCC